MNPNQNKNKQKINNFVFIMIIIIVGVMIGYFLTKNDSKIDINEERWIVENYLKGNISEISPEKEVLGGKFYIINIDWAENNSGQVEYEDGHISLKADFSYEIDWENKAVNIKDFDIVE